MHHQKPVLTTRLIPPRPQRRVLERPALQATLAEALEYRLTIVQAGTGYGKTTALAALAAQVPRCCWYSLDAADNDPNRFFAYLIAAFRTGLPQLSDAPQAALQDVEQGSGDGWLVVADAIINALEQAIDGPTLLVLDDYHMVAGVAPIDALMERLLSYLPHDLHLVIATRHPLPWAELVRWQVRGDVLEIGRAALAFPPDDIAALFQTAYGMALTQEDVAALSHKTEGWPIALQLIWQGVRHRSVAALGELLRERPDSLGALFEYLARDVLARQPQHVAAFLRETAVLRDLTPAACDAVRAAPGDAASLLDQLHEQGLFLVALGEQHYRYHQLFHEFLRQQAASDPVAVRERHRRAAHFARAQGQPEEAIYHWLAADDMQAAADAIAETAEPILRAGRLDTVAGWLDALPPLVLASRPRLHALLGDLSRMRSRFDEALEWYRQSEQACRATADWAGTCRALRGQANVYLDTFNPVEAERLLGEALRLTDRMDDRAAHARLLELLAEHKLNLGKPAEAEMLRTEAQVLRADGPHEDALSVRVMLRTGRLDAAEQVLQGWLEDETREEARGHARAPRSHRETVLLLSLIQTMRGEAQQAMELAQRGIVLGARRASPFITSVAHARLGHACQLAADTATDPAERTALRATAQASYETASSVGDRIAVPRLHVEAMWGLTRLHGYAGDIATARTLHGDAARLGRQAGDIWIATHIDLALGASLALAGHAEEALGIFWQTLAAARECRDMLGRAAARLWLALAYHMLGQPEQMLASLRDGLALAESGGYDALWTRPTLLGPPDVRILTPLLVMARDAGVQPQYAARLLGALGIPQIQFHPGYQLRVQVLGGFRVWRGQHELEQKAWQRGKARQLLQILLAAHSPLPREALCDRLWPESTPEAAQRDFKVALNALYKALEPNRPPDAPSAFIARDGTTYALRPEADIWRDDRAFESACLQGQKFAGRGAPERAILAYADALRLYSGEFLPDVRYDDWAETARTRLHERWLRAADALAGLYLEQGRNDEALDVAAALLQHDRCWERAYRIQMCAYTRQGNRSQALRAYQRCAAALRDELGLEPDTDTTTLYERIRDQDRVVG